MSVRCDKVGPPESRLRRAYWRDCYSLRKFLACATGFRVYLSESHIQMEAKLNMMRSEIGVLTMLAGAGLLAAPAFAENSAVGLWKNTEPNKVTMIRTYEEGGKLQGKIEKVLKNDVEDKEAKCIKCKDENKDKPMSGLKLIWDMQGSGEKWSGGKLLDPESGRVVNCKLEAADGGKKLVVKGSVGIISKTQTWTRAD